MESEIQTAEEQGRKDNNLNLPHQNETSKKPLNFVNAVGLPNRAVEEPSLHSSTLNEYSPAQNYPNPQQHLDFVGETNYFHLSNNPNQHNLNQHQLRVSEKSQQNPVSLGFGETQQQWSCETQNLMSGDGTFDQPCLNHCQAQVIGNGSVEQGIQNQFQPYEHNYGQNGQQFHNLSPHQFRQHLNQTPRRECDGYATGQYYPAQTQTNGSGDQRERTQPANDQHYNQLQSYGPSHSTIGQPYLNQPHPPQSSFNFGYHHAVQQQLDFIGSSPSINQQSRNMLPDHASGNSWNIQPYSYHVEPNSQEIRNGSFDLHHNGTPQKTWITHQSYAQPPPEETGNNSNIQQGLREQNGYNNEYNRGTEYIGFSNSVSGQIQGIQSHPKQWNFDQTTSREAENGSSDHYHVPKNCFENRTEVQPYYPDIGSSAQQPVFRYQPPDFSHAVNGQQCSNQFGDRKVDEDAVHPHSLNQSSQYHTSEKMMLPPIDSFLTGSTADLISVVSHENKITQPVNADINNGNYPNRGGLISLPYQHSNPSYFGFSEADTSSSSNWDQVPMIALETSGMNVQSILKRKNNEEMKPDSSSKDVKIFHRRNKQKTENSPEGEELANSREAGSERQDKYQIKQFDRKKQLKKYREVLEGFIGGTNPAITNGVPKTSIQNRTARDDEIAEINAALEEAHQDYDQSCVELDMIRTLKKKTKQSCKREGTTGKRASKKTILPVAQMKRLFEPELDDGSVKMDTLRSRKTRAKQLKEFYGMLLEVYKLVNVVEKQVALAEFVDDDKFSSDPFLSKKIYPDKEPQNELQKCVVPLDQIDLQEICRFLANVKKETVDDRTKKSSKKNRKPQK